MPYTPDPSTADSPLTDEELAELIRSGGKDLVKPKQLSHFLARVAATLRMHTEERRMLNRQITLIETRKSYEGGQPTTLRPADAVRFLSRQERAALSEATTREYLEALERKIGELDATRLRVNQTLAAARLLAEEAAAAPLDPAVEARLRALIAALVGERHTPAQLDAQLAAARAATGAPTPSPATPAAPGGSGPSPAAPPATPTGPPGGPGPAAWPEPTGAPHGEHPAPHGPARSTSATGPAGPPPGPVDPWAHLVASPPPAAPPAPPTPTSPPRGTP